MRVPSVIERRNKDSNSSSYSIICIDLVSKRRSIVMSPLSDSST